MCVVLFNQLKNSSGLGASFAEIPLSLVAREGFLISQNIAVMTCSQATERQSHRSDNHIFRLFQTIKRLLLTSALRRILQPERHNSPVSRPWLPVFERTGIILNPSGASGDFPRCTME